uniref:(northern house mosquito) hypothetical protein n=1 Tax=Culex pipiens TaxID=7175 RepID=A0A8D8IGF4_CULPI
MVSWPGSSCSSATEASTASRRTRTLYRKGTFRCCRKKTRKRSSGSTVPAPIRGCTRRRPWPSSSTCTITSSSSRVCRSGWSPARTTAGRSTRRWAGAMGPACSSSTTPWTTRTTSRCTVR